LLTPKRRAQPNNQIHNSSGGDTDATDADGRYASSAASSKQPIEKKVFSSRSNSMRTLRTLIFKRKLKTSFYALPGHLANRHCNF
jgi:hypothetical protein